MSDADLSLAEDDEFLAAEYALGLLDPAERRRLERRMREDAAFRARVEAWEARLAPMLDGIAPVEAPPAILPLIEAELDRQGRERRPVNDNRVAPAWKWFGLGSFGLLAASLLALFVVTQARIGAPPLTAVIAPTDGPAIYAVVIDSRQSRATLIPLAVSPDPNHSHELWTLAPNAEPRSLGVLQPDAPVQVALPPDLLAGATSLAISVEPPGGSPTGLPTGPVVGTGPLKRI